MNNIDLIRMSIGNLWRRKLRTSLTVLGVIIGTSSIVLMISLGLAMSANFKSQVEQWGSLTVIEVHSSGDRWSEKGGVTSNQAGQLDDMAVESLKKIQNVQMVIPTLQVNANLIMGKYVTPWGVNIVGMDPEMMAALDYIASEGRDMLPNEENIIVMGAEIPKELIKKGKIPNWEHRERAPLNYFEDRAQITFESLDPYSNQGGSNFPGETKKIKLPKPLDVKVVGILPEGNWDTANSLYMPIKNVIKLIEDKQKYDAQLSGKPISKKKTKKVYNNVKVKANDMKNVTAIQEELQNLGYSAYSNMDTLNQMNEMAQGIQLVLGGIGAISLLVAAIGITNTMIMAIYERTREIGIMKVIGAVISDIRKMFLIESAFIGFLGGTVGVVFCYLASWILNTFGAGFAGGLMGMGNGGDVKTYVSIIPIWLSLFALGFSTIIGLVAGYFPAKRAMKLSALSAIKTQ
ncbi:MAG TPA: ABC transporter permease [Epulopiscium sp.]|nr:ABC transporter permease [Candidatus Epulonipiscium sp.]